MSNWMSIYVQTASQNDSTYSREPVGENVGWSTMEKKPFAVYLGKEVIRCTLTVHHPPFPPPNRCYWRCPNLFHYPHIVVARIAPLIRDNRFWVWVLVVYSHGVSQYQREAIPIVHIARRGFQGHW